jgi:lipid-binding SYLF domain-containing protein
MPLLVVACAQVARAGDLEDLVDDASATIGRFTADPEMDWFRDHMRDAKAVLVVPRLLKGGFIFGGSGGSGVLLARDPQTGAWSYPAFYTIGSFTVGAQIGGEAAEIVLLILTQRGMDSMLATSVKLGADVEVAAGPVGVGTKAATVDVLAFSRTKGLFAGASVEGAIVAARDGWNEEYYRRSVRPPEILVESKVTNPHADPLREALTRLSGDVGQGRVSSRPAERGDWKPDGHRSSAAALQKCTGWLETTSRPTGARGFRIRRAPHGADASA